MRINKTLFAAAALAFGLTAAGTASASASTSTTASTTASASASAETAHLTTAGTTYYKTYSTSYIACPAGRLCLYTAPHYRGLQVSWKAGDYTPDFQTIKCASGWCQSNGDFNDEASSWANNSTNMSYCVSQDAQGGGPENTMPNLTQGNFKNGWDGIASSLSFQGCP